MRLVKVKTPEGKGSDVARLAHEVGIDSASVHQISEYKQTGKETKDMVELSSSTPNIKTFIEALTSAPFFDPNEYPFSIREPRTIAASQTEREVTRPLVIPSTDVLEELWQFSHITFSFVCRVFIAAALLSYGMIEANLLLMIAGLLFLPLLPLLLSVGFGAWTRQWSLVVQGAFAYVLATAIIVAAGALVALVTEPPLKFHEFSPTPVAFLISIIVGIAAGLATSDDAGRRELIGLAATAQIATIPAWLGITLVFGLSPIETITRGQRAATFGVNTVTIIIASLITYAALRMRIRSAHR